MISQSSVRQWFLAGEPHWRRSIILGCLLWLLGAAAAVASPFALQTRAGYFGDPYLSTNTGGQIFLVINDEMFQTNSAYRDKVAVLASQENSDPQNPWAYVIDSAKKAAGARQLFAPAPLPTKPAPAQESVGLSRTPPRASPLDDDFRQRAVQFSYVLQHWLLFGLVALFILRRIWRYFREVEDDDDFADHLATLAVAHRWVFPVYMAMLISVAAAEYLQSGNLFLSLSVLTLASSLRGYYCEGDFAELPTAQKFHLALTLVLVWLGWRVGFDNYLADATTWFHHGRAIPAWVGLFLFLRAFRGFVNGPDFAEQRGHLTTLLLCYGAIALVGGGTGASVWIRLGWRDTVWMGAVYGAIFGGILLTVAFLMGKNPVFSQFIGGTLIDMFLPRSLGGKMLRQKRQPSLLLLQHWREQGDLDKAWAAARAHLVKESRALPVWLFAMETAVLYRRQPEDALDILARLCAAEEFRYDHRMVAVAQMQGWMEAAGFEFDAARYQIEQPPLEPSSLAEQVEQKCQAGHPHEAAVLLRAVLEKDGLNEVAFAQLVRVYCQDLKNRPGALRLIADARDTFGPGFLNLLESSLDDWIKLPVRSIAKRKGFFARLWPEKPKAPRPSKISLIAPPITLKPRAEGSADAMQSYLERVRQSHGKPADSSRILDPADKLLAERRLGTAVEMIKQQAEAAPGDFELWLRYAEAQGHHCANPTAAEKIIRQMEGSGRFKKAQMKKAHTRLRKWWKLHATHQDNW